MKSSIFLFSFMIWLLMSGCAVGQKVTLANKFNEDKASYILNIGNNTLKGSAMIRQSGGGIVTCAGNNVAIIPATEYSKERIFAIYNNYNKAYKQYNIYSNVVAFENDDINYHKFKKSTICNPLGFFVIENLSDGEYFLTTQVTWNVGGYINGGFLMERVSLSNGETKEIILAP